MQRALSNTPTADPWHVVWQVRTGEPWGRAGHIWTDYSVDYCRLLEEALAHERQGIEYQPGARYTYRIDVYAMTQTTLATGNVRPVRRLVISAEASRAMLAAERCADEASEQLWATWRASRTGPVADEHGS